MVLAISRVIGETAPLLVVAGATDGINTNLFDGRMTTLPVFIFSQYALVDTGRLPSVPGAARSC